MSENTGEVFNKNAFFAKMNQQKENLKEGVNNVRGSETFQNLSNKGAVGLKTASAGVTSGFDRLGFGTEEERKEKKEKLKKESMNTIKSLGTFGRGIYNYGKETMNKTLEKGRNPENQPVGGRKTKKSRRNKRKSTRKTRKNKRKTKKSKKSKRKSRKSRRK